MGRRVDDTRSFVKVNVVEHASLAHDDQPASQIPPVGRVLPALGRGESLADEVIAGAARLWNRALEQAG